MPDDSQILRGRVQLRDPAPAGGVLHVRLEDVRRLDAPATVISEVDIAVADAQPAGAVIAFALALPRTRDLTGPGYSVRAHYDRSGSRQIEAGDLLSTRACPLTDPAQPLEIEIHRI